MSTDGTHVGARVSDRDLLEALDGASDEHGSRSEAVRHALRSTFGGGGDDPDAGDLEDVPAGARAGYEVLRDQFGTDRMIEVGAAKSIIAERERIPKESIRSVVFEPLREAGLLGVSTQVRSAFVYVIEP